jgi:hypothetical protein
VVELGLEFDEGLVVELGLEFDQGLSVCTLDLLDLRFISERAYEFLPVAF